MSVGLNKYIDAAITILEDNLWDRFNNSYNGRSFRLKKSNRVQSEIYAGNNNYQEVLPTDKFDSIVHFDAEPVRPKTSTQQATANVNIIFAVNLGEIYGTSTYASEEAIRDINKVLVNTAFTIENIVEFPDALSDYDLTPDEEHKFNMQPYYVVKFETTCNYGLNNVCVPVSPTQYTLTTTSGLGGSIIPSYTDQIFNKGVKVPLYVEADEGNMIDEILVNNVEETNNPFNATMNQDTLVEASFITMVLNNIMQILNSAPVKFGYQWRFLNNDGNSDNYAICKKTTVFKLISPLSGIQHLLVNYNNSPSFETIIKPIEGGQNEIDYIYSRRTGGNEFVFAIDVANNKTKKIFLSYWASGVLTTITSTNIYDVGKWGIFGFTMNNTTKKINIYYENLEDGTNWNEEYSFVGTLDNAASSSVIFQFQNPNPSSTLVFNGLAAMYKINDGERICYLQNLNGNSVYNSANNKIQDGLIFNGNGIAEYYIQDSIGVVEPFSYTKGVSIFSDDTAPTDITKNVNVVYSEDGTPAITTITGYTLIGNFPANSGILNSIKNTILFNSSNELVAFFSNYDMGVITTEKEFAEIEDWAETAEIVKEYTEINGVNVAITKLEFKT